MTFQRTVTNRLAFLDKSTPPWAVWSVLIGIAVIWEGIVRLGWVSELYLPGPVSILAAAAVMAGSGELLSNLQASLFRIAAGFAIGSIAGIMIGLLLGFSRLAEAVGNPIVHLLYPIPKIALLPLIILWLGIGELSKVTIIALGVFFPVVINTYSGVRHIDVLLIKVAVSFKATPLSLIRKVILPGALPSIFAGLKLAAGSSLLLLVAAEMIAAKEGIGALILHYGDLMLTTKLMVGVLVLSLLGVLFNQLLHWLERKLLPWLP